MSEFDRRSGYSPAAQALLDGFCSWEHRPDERAEYETRRLVCTNNLGLRMDALTQGPESLNYQFYFQSLPQHLQALLETNRTANPDLWESSVGTYRERSAAATMFSQQLATQDPQLDETKRTFEALIWQHNENMTAILDTLEPLTPEDALDLCR